MTISTSVRRIWPGLLLALAAPQAMAADAEPWPLLEQERDRWDACAGRPLPAMPSPGLHLPDDPDAPMVIDADNLRYDRNTGIWDLDGDVELERGHQRLRSDEMRFDERSRRADAIGRMAFRQPGLALAGSRGYLLLDEDQGELDDAEYLLTETLTQGRAQHVEMETRDLLHLTDATYSTCEPDNELWRVRASRIRLNRETGRGDAWHARMAIGGVPLLYVPYVNFPIDDRRKSGLLPPTLRQSDRSGAEVTVPFYWNIAPNYDATITPRYFSRRGIMLDTEFRYLRPRQEGELRTAYLPDDDERGSDRWSVAWNHRANLPGRLRFTGELNRVSDDDYFRDFGTTLYRSSSNNLISRAQLRYQSPDITSRLRTEIFQNLNPDLARRNRPYERVPAADFLYVPGRSDLGPLAAQPGLYAEVARFDHPARDLRDTGNRLDLTPRMSLPFERPAGFVRPSLAARLTSYDLDRAGPTEDQDTSVNRALPVASLDMGLLFDRHFSAFNRDLTQTLEPRLYYLYVPYTDQDDIPLFDTGVTEPSLFQLFSEDRFTGGDRVGDANQVSVGLSSRFLDRRTGREHFRVGVGQAFHFSDRRVTPFPDQEPDTRSHSDIIGETEAYLPAGFQARTELHWDPDESRTSLAGARLSWLPETDLRDERALQPVVTVGYRSRHFDDQRRLDQGDIAFILPLGDRWSTLGGWRYSILENRTLEAFGGLEYRDCCWSIRLVNRYYREELAEEPDRSIMLQFEFRGLGHIGDNVRNLLDETVFGYERLR